MSTKTLFSIVVMASLLMVGGVASAQGGNRNNDPQGQAYRHGGIGFVDPETGAQWNGQQRGRMGSGTGQNGVGFYASLPPATTDELPDNIIALMIDGWEDESRAYAVYEMVMQQFGEVTPFVNIQRAELQHQAAWEFLFERYGIQLPSATMLDPIDFESLADACQLGVTAEIENAALYDTMLDEFNAYPDLYQVALALRNASEFNHLPAFENCAG